MYRNVATEMSRDRNGQTESASPKRLRPKRLRPNQPDRKVVYAKGWQLYAKSASTRRYLRSFGNLCSSAAYNQGRLTLFF